MKKRSIAALLAALMIAASFSACSGNGGGSESQGNTPNSDVDENERITLTFFDKNSGNSQWDDHVAKAISEKTNVDIKIQNPTGDPLEKLNLMLAAKDYPDMVLMDRANEIVNKYIDAGALVQLDEYIEQRGENIKEMYGDTLKKIRYTDGHNYYLSNWFGMDPDCVSGFIMRYDLIKELAPDLADSNEAITQDQMMDIMKAYKAKYPDGTAMTWDAENETYMTPLKGMYGLKTYSVAEDGSLQHVARDPKYIEMLKFCNEMYRNNLLDKEWVVNKNTLWTQKLSSGDVFGTLSSYWDVAAANTSLASTVGPDAQLYAYKVLGDGIASDETTYGARNTLGWDAIGITSNCKNVERAVDFADFMVSEEGQYLKLWGVEGEDWEIKDGVHTANEDLLKGMVEDSNGTIRSTGVRLWSWFVKNGNGSDGTPYDILKVELTDAAVFANKNLPDTNWDMAEYDALEPVGSTPEGLKYQKVQDVFDQAFPKIIAASSEEECVQLYEKMISDMDAAGLKDVEKVINENYDAKMKIWNE